MNSNSVYVNENSSIENCTSYSDHTEPELVHKDHRVYRPKVIAVG